MHFSDAQKTHLHDALLCGIMKSRLKLCLGTVRKLRGGFFVARKGERYGKN
jgi:hypothetical protein